MTEEVERNWDAPPPDDLGQCVDEYREVRDLRLAMEKEVAMVQKRETALREHLIANISKSDSRGVYGQQYRATIVTKPAPKAADWSLIFDFIRENDRLDLLQKRLSDKVVLEMADAGEPVPGVEIVLVPGVSVTKI